MNIEDYILYRIETLRKAKLKLANNKINGAKNMLLEINTRLSELEGIAIEFKLGLKDETNG